LPLLPVIVGSSLSGEFSLRKVLTITSSLGISIILFTFILKVSTAFIAVPQYVWSDISGGILIVFGFLTLFPAWWDELPFVSGLNASSNRLLAEGYRKENFWGNVIIGLALGPIFSSCSPTYFVILATVLPQSLSLGFLDLLAYAAGLSLSLLAIAVLGQKLVEKLGGVSDTRGAWRRVLGAIFILLGILVLFGADKTIEARILDSGFDITRVEQYLLRFNDTSGESASSIPKSHGPKAPEIVDPSGFINTGGEPITIGQFKGKKVVLLDIWTYSCINCRRTLPYIESWYEKYKDEGLEVIGLHTPEFAFEKVQSNVEEAVKELGLTYPIVMDNDYATWNAFGNQYWPRKYLINEDGEIIYDHIGEGGYDETEKAIQAALSELNQKDLSGTTTAPAAIVSDASKVGSPETYFGAARNEYFGNGTPGATGRQTLGLPDAIRPNLFYLEGTWNFDREFAESETSGKIVFRYTAKNIYMVASSDEGVVVKIVQDGKLVKELPIRQNTLYTLMENPDYGTHTLEIDAPPGLLAFTFTFG
jgi:cytochrome c biogenesis protein CcdA/thiol-disulfide isomerase/thioredoxin